MALRIFDTDPDAKPKDRKEYVSDVAFNFRSGRKVGNRPISLPAFRVTTGAPAIAAAVAELYGGTPQDWETSKEDDIEVLTEAHSVKIILSGPSAVTSTLIHWGRNGPIHECDGEFSLMDDDKGQPCGCPRLMADRKELAKKDRGPAPNTKIRFRLVDDQDLGVGVFTSSSWALVEVLHEIEEALSHVEGEALAELTLEPVEFISSAGETVSYRKPVLKVLGSWNDAIAS